MGTTYSIRYVPEPGSPAPGTLHQRIDSELELVNQQMSTYIKDSEISKFNDSPSTDWVAVSLETAQVVALAQQISNFSHGAFDVTVAPLVNLWGFGPAGRAESIPDQSKLDLIVAAVGYDKLSVRLDPPALRKSVSSLRVDLSAIAKGHGVDRVGKVLSENGIDHYFVEIGGEIRTKGRRSDGGAWRVGIEAPVDGRSIQSIIELSNLAIATSGDYRNYFELDGQRYSHTIDPSTGRPVQHSLASASVVAADCATADAIATCMMVLGPVEGLRLAEQQDWQVLLIERDSDRLVTTCSSLFAKRFPSTCGTTP